METMAAISLVITNPCLCNWSGNQVFLRFHSKSLVPTPAVRDNQKCSPQADLLYNVFQICQMYMAFPHRDREHRKNVYFFKFCHNPHPIWSMVKLRKLKCTHYNLWLLKYLLYVITLNDANHWYSTKLTIALQENNNSFEKVSCPI